MPDNPDKSSKREAALEAAGKDGGRSESNAIEDFVAGLLPSGGSRGNFARGEKGGQRTWGQDEVIQNINPDEKGVIKLDTGDTFVRAGGVESVTTKDGGSVTVKPDGTYKVKGGTAKFDLFTRETTVHFGDGRSVTIRDGRIDSVTDIKHTVFMNRKPNEFRRNPYFILDNDWKPEFTQPDALEQLMQRLKLQRELGGITPKPYSDYDPTFPQKR